MLRFAAFLLCAAVFALAPSTRSALAQKAAPKQTAIPTDPDGLARWCSARVFLKYGDRNSSWGRKYVAMPLDQHATLQDSCIRSKGRTY